MSIVDLLALFSNPQRMQDLTMAQKMTASLITTLLGMGITGLALVLLQLSISCMAAFTTTISNRKKAKHAIGPASEKNVNADNELDQEVVAAITVSLSVMLERSPEHLIIRDIKRVNDPGSAWGKAGLNEHMYHSA